MSEVVPLSKALPVTKVLPVTKTFIDHVKTRRTQYALGKNIPQGPEEVSIFIQEAMRHAPSSFNSQSSRAVILFGEQSDRLWFIAKDILRKIVPAEAFPATEARLDGFAAGIGTVLFFEDQDVVKGLQENFPLYADNFPTWSEHASGMAQFAVWTALASHGIGASLQHYNPLIDEAVQRQWQVPASWKLRAQMPFGSNEQPVGDKVFMDDAERFKIFA